MKITPLEIRQKTFEKAFRGLDKDEVNAFLVTLSQEWEKLVDENKELKIKLDASQKEIEKLREVENSLFKTLKTAEDTGANMIDQATKTAELHLKETQMKAEAMLNDAKHKAKDMIEEAEVRSRNTVEEMEDQVRSMAQVYRNLENIREDLLSDIKTFASDAIDKVNRVKGHAKSFNVEEHLLQVKRGSVGKISSKMDFDEVKVEKIASLEQFGNASKNHKKPAGQAEEPVIEEKEEKKEGRDSQNSFFDDIE